MHMVPFLFGQVPLARTLVHRCAAARASVLQCYSTQLCEETTALSHCDNGRNGLKIMNVLYIVCGPEIIVRQDVYVRCACAPVAFGALARQSRSLLYVGALARQMITAHTKASTVHIYSVCDHIEM